MRKKNRFIVACQGILSVFQTEQNFRIHLFAFVAAISFGFVFQISKMEWIAVLSCSFLVLICEIFNTAIEKLCNHVSPQYDVHIGKVKDISAAAVFISAILSLVIGIIVFIPYFIQWYCDLA